MLAPTSRIMFEPSGNVADLTGLPFEQVARSEAVDGPGPLFNLVRALPRDSKSREQALQTTASGSWTNLPRR